jgi:antirestriction protein ArdC
MQEEQARHLTDEALKLLTEELQTGKSGALKTYLTAMSRFHHYSWNNVMLIQTQRPAATRVAGYHTWRDLGRFVRKGEKGIMIYAPIVAKTTQLERPGERPDRQLAPEIQRQVTAFRTAYVFDVAQTDGRPLPAFAQTTGDPQTYGDKLKAMVARYGIALEYTPAIAPAQGNSSGGRIRLLPGMSPGEEFSTLVHEFTHELLHHGTDRGQVSQVVRETQAEAVAFVVSRGIGLEGNRSASDYIALYNGNMKTLAESLAAIQRTASRILDELLPQERPAAEREAHADRTNTRSLRSEARVPDSELAQAEPARATAADRVDDLSLDR